MNHTVLAERSLVSSSYCYQPSKIDIPRSGRNWSYLWNNQYIPKWAIVVMIIIFFIGLWILMMGTLISTSIDAFILDSS